MAQIFNDKATLCYYFIYLFILSIILFIYYFIYLLFISINCGYRLYIYFDVAQNNVIEEKLLEIKRCIRRGIYLFQIRNGHFSR